MNTQRNVLPDPEFWPEDNDRWVWVIVISVLISILLNNC